MFKVGDTVQRVNQPEAVGRVIEVRSDSQTESWLCIVQFPDGTRAVPENAIREFKRTRTPWEALADYSLSGRDHFVFTLTFHRLRHPPARIARSFATARTQFYPYQFKPVLKFLENPGKRLLLADEVGLGKTIEAGYILRELDIRQGRLERVLVLVPARLVPKWKKEMQKRFEEPFEVVKGQEIIAQTQRLRRGQEIDAFRWIVSYESARSEDVQKALEDTQLPIDLWIADEAHRMRNPDTLQHKIGAALCLCADNVIFLSATPVQTGLENLWNLLRLLAPNEFRAWPVFQQQMAANRLLLETQRALARHPANLVQARKAFSDFCSVASTLGLLGGEFFQSIESRIQSDTLEPHEVSELEADIALLSPTAQIISRTRKVEALPNRPLRNAGWVLVRFTDVEREVYDNVEELCRLAWGLKSTSWGYQMSLLMAYRITASCIPAAMEYFNEKLKGIPSAAGQGTESEVEDDDADQGLGDDTVWTVQESRQKIERILDSHKTLGTTDSKLEKLVEALRKFREDDERTCRPIRKVVVFSYFRRTLEHLSRSLRRLGFENEMIHGLIPVEERENAIDLFWESSDINVLLTSEVGGEGIDLQKACIVVNYDLPWNPMVVEQRIGRVDRIGQESPIIYVLNFVVEGSIEERILQRLLTRIRVFEESIGELDTIIGDEIEELATKALRGELAGDELERVLRQTEEAMGHRVSEARAMLSQVDGLLAADQALIHEVNAVVGERQIPTEKELLLFLNRFLTDRYPGCQLPEEAASRVVSADLHGPLAQDIDKKSITLGDDALSFARRISTGNVSLTLSREAAYRHPRAELVHLNHPLCRLAVSELQAEEVQHGAAFALAIPPGRLVNGDYAFLLAILHIPSYRPNSKMVAVVISTEGEQTFIDPDETTPILLEILEKGRDVESLPVSLESLEGIKERLLATLAELKATLDARERKLDQARRERQHGSQTAGLDFRVSRAQERLNNLLQSGAQEFAIRMTKAQLTKALKERDAFVVAKPETLWAGIEHEEVAVGFLFVREDA